MPNKAPKPDWLRIKLPSGSQLNDTMTAISDRSLFTVCVEAQCPNRANCFSKGTATFLLLGPNCTRSCTFCAVGKSKVSPPDPFEPVHIAEAVKKLGLTYCVLTMVTRDDLTDGGGGHIANTITAVRSLSPDIDIEVLISDLAGNTAALKIVLDAGPVVLNHNIETIPRLYETVRPQADYQRSLNVLNNAAQSHHDVIAKSGMMLGLGETEAEVLATMQDLRSAGVRLLTLGQYLSPSDIHHPVIRYVHPDEFQEFERKGLVMGFDAIASAPLVRSSYKAGDLYRSIVRPIE